MKSWRGWDLWLKTVALELESMALLLKIPNTSVTEHHAGVNLETWSFLVNIKMLKMLSHMENVSLAWNLSSKCGLIDNC